MKKSSSIYLLFFLFVIAVIICFWIGFVFGKYSQRQTDLVKISELQLSTDYAGKNNISSSENIVKTSDNAKEIAQEDRDQTTTVNSELKQPKFYMKQKNDYVVVYVSATDEVYFETDILISELPVELQEEMEYGIDFYDLENVYTFLENYSS